MLRSTGVLGGFTTYSAYAGQWVEFANTGRALRGVAYVALQIILAFVGCRLGASGARRLRRR